MTATDVFADVSEIYEFDDESLDYYDGPLSGWLKHRVTGEWFAFDCQPIIHGLLWHWTLVPATKTGDAGRVLGDARNASAGSWLSIVEDRRAGAPQCRAVRIDNAIARPVLFSSLYGGGR